MLNEDYRDILQSFVAEQVKFILVGAYALAAHGYPRSTMDIDIEGLSIHIPSVADLIRNKLATGRTKDLADVETLRAVIQI